MGFWQIGEQCSIHISYKALRCPMLKVDAKMNVKAKFYLELADALCFFCL